MRWYAVWAFCTLVNLALLGAFLASHPPVWSLWFAAIFANLCSWPALFLARRTA